MKSAIGLQQSNFRSLISYELCTSFKSRSDTNKNTTRIKKHRQGEYILRFDEKFDKEISVTFNGNGSIGSPTLVSPFASRPLPSPASHPAA